MSDESTMPFGTPTPDWQYPQQKCPHCDEHPTANRLDEHIATAHSDLPECTARIDGEHGTYTCAFRVGHSDGEYGDRHASIYGSVGGRSIWADWAPGAVPHRNEEERDA